MVMQIFINETLREKYPNFMIQNMDIKGYENAETVYEY